MSQVNNNNNNRDHSPRRCAKKRIVSVSVEPLRLPVRKEPKPLPQDLNRYTINWQDIQRPDALRIRNHQIQLVNGKIDTKNAEAFLKKAIEINNDAKLSDMDKAEKDHALALAKIRQQQTDAVNKAVEKIRAQFAAKEEREVENLQKAKDQIAFEFEAYSVCVNDQLQILKSLESTYPN